MLKFIVPDHFFLLKVLSVHSSPIRSHFPLETQDCQPFGANYPNRISLMQELQDDIILAFRQGDTNAFVTIYRHFYQSIFIFCKYIVPVSEAEDIASETFLRLWKTREKWDSIVNVKAFLYMTARNKCFDFLRHQKTVTKNQREIAYLTANDHDNILFSEIEAEVIKEVKKEIENLPENCKEVFRMYFFEGKQNPEIAEKLSLSDKTVRNLKSIALKAIKANIFIRGLQINLTVIFVRLIDRLV